MSKRAIGVVLLAWVLWLNDPNVGLRTAEYLTFEKCKDAAKRINQEHERRRKSDPSYRIYVGEPAFCAERLPMPWDVPLDKRYY
jgi:hypothetical protein